MEKGLKVKIIIILAGILCLVFFLGSIVVQNLPEKSDQKTKSKKEAVFDGISSYVLGSAYGSCGSY